LITDEFFRGVHAFVFRGELAHFHCQGAEDEKVEGKSPLFMAVIIMGYLSGIAHKVLYNFDWVTVFYGVNAAMVAADLFLYYRYLSPDAAAGGETGPLAA